MKHIFLLGDSIRLGYETALQQLAGPQIRFWSPEENCRFAQYVLRYAHQWAEACPAEQVELVVWNCGLWDVLRIMGDEPLTPLPVYGDFLLRISRRLGQLFPVARQLFLTSTPTVEARYTGHSCRRNRDIEAYNAAARSVMEGLGVPVLDLYAVAAAFPREWRADHVHYAPAGSEALARAILAQITAMAE